MRIYLLVTMLLFIVTACTLAIAGTRNRLRLVEKVLQDSLEKDRLKYMNEVLASIRGREKKPAHEVFKNLKVILGESAVSAEHLLWMMNWGWSAELGVSCSHCHVKGNWESDAVPAKNIARGMWTMRVRINKELLPAITGTSYDSTPAVTCITCHRKKPVPVN